MTQSNPTKTGNSSSAAAAEATKPLEVSKLDPSRILNLNVGVLGHVDSGKTSLVKTLSTLLSTASLDKSSQSRQRGITLDLGFSAFLMPLPPSISTNDDYKDKYDALQVTLVDCPGHASLIRTIIGGAQIIDMVLLVVDATKGIQTQTAECLVIAEMTTQNLIVALNKIDLFPEEEREARLGQVQAKIRSVLSKTRFRDAPMVGISACVGGEKVAAVSADSGASHGKPSSSSSSSSDPSKSSSSSSNAGKDSKSKSTSSAAANSTSTQTTQNIQGLLALLQTKIKPPNRDSNNVNDGDGDTSTPAAFHFAIDHCFPIKGQGTVLTGTCLAGSIQTNEMIEFPTLSLQRKIKSLQMFRRKVGIVRQGDRAGMCVANLDPNLMERGVAATPGSVRLISGALAVVRKVRYYRGSLGSGTKFHVSVGHTTVMATVVFWGAREIRARLQGSDGADNVGDGDGSKQKDKKEPKSNQSGDGKKVKTRLTSSSLGGNADIAGLPNLTFDYEEDFLQQDDYIETLDDEEEEGDGSKTQSGSDTESNTHNHGSVETAAVTTASSTSAPLHWAMLDFQTPVYCPLDSLIIGSRLDTDIQANTCRLAFSGRLVEKFDPKNDFNKIRLYTRKEKYGVVCRLGDPYRRDDDGKTVRYEVYGNDLFKKETNMTQFIGLQIETEKRGSKQKDIGVIQSSFGTSGKFKVHFPAGTEVREGDKLFLRFKRFLHDPEKKIRQDMNLPAPRVGTRITNITGKKERNRKKHGNASATAGGNGGGSTGANTKTNVPKTTPVSESIQTKVDPSKKPLDAASTQGNGASAATNQNANKNTTSAKVFGEIASVKGDALENGNYAMAIVAGFFTPEINIREKVGMKVQVVGTNETGFIAGSFGKAGKCKVSFPNEGLSSPVGTKVELILS